MKKLFFLLLAGLLITGVASASSMYFLDCVPLPVSISGGNGTQVTTCPVMPALPVGDTLTAIIVWDTGDYQFGTGTGTNEVQIIETPSAGTWVDTGWAGVGITCDISGAGSSNTTACTPSEGYPPSSVYQTFNGTVAAMDTLAAAGFTVSDASTVVEGSVGTSSAGNFVEYDYTGPAPEPATMAMVGGMFIGLAALARKRRA